jgi:hypothetical protein
LDEKNQKRNRKCLAVQLDETAKYLFTFPPNEIDDNEPSLFKVISEKEYAERKEQRAKGFRLFGKKTKHEPKQGSNLKKFTHSFRANGIRITLEAVPMGDKCLITISNSREGEKQRKVSSDFMNKLEALIDVHGLCKWDGFCESSPYHQYICESFFLKIDFANGKKVRAEGSSAFPEGFMQANPAIYKLFGLKIL